ncbi:MAG: methyltransferase domain-containing protein [Deltaproteobacteria bacterium]|nr:methyltransferase domain-containing protein [Deltaproteobacteria bacterium]
MRAGGQNGAPIGQVIRDSGIASVLAVLIGGVTTAMLLREAGGSPLGLLHRGAGSAFALGALLAGSAFNFGGRWIRWQYLLRVCEVRLPTRESARLFFSSFAVLLTPLYLGEIIFKAFVLQRRRTTPVGLTAAVALAERLYDFAALMLIAGLAGLASGHATGWLLLPTAALCIRPIRRALMAAAAWPVMAAGKLALGADTQPARETMLALADDAVSLPTVALSVLCWLPVTLALWLVGIAGALPIGLVPGARLFSTSALLGGVSLLPAGVAIAGQSMVHGLTELGVEFPRAVAAVVLVRLGTLGLAIGVGLAALAWTAWRGEFADTGAQAHFDRVSAVYDAEIPLHVRDYVVRRKVDLMAAGITGAAPVGLDLGCGRGYYLEELRRRGYRVVGSDLSAGQLRTARAAGEAVAADASQLPFPDGTFDFVYSVNMFHHLPRLEMRRQGLAEIRRVLKPGGRFFLHEINVTNPLFRFYMSYVFPILRHIDDGTERWILPATLAGPPGLSLCAVRYFTFIPDFLPRWAARWMHGLEQRLEASRWAQFSAHFVADFERT